MTNKSTVVEDRIRELVPRLKELSKGCRIVVSMRAAIDPPLQHCRIINTDHKQKYFGLDYGYHTGTGTCIRNDIEEVIGHPITLEDVFEALGISKEFVIGGSEDCPSNDWIDIIREWEYGKSFDQQTKGTQDFIESLLK